MKFSLFFIFSTIFCRSFAQDFSGIWKGNLAIDKDTLALIFHIRQEGSQWAASMDIPFQDAFKLPAEVSIENNKIHIETESEINIKGEMINANEIKAVFLQRGFEKDLKFSRVLDTNQLFSSYSLKRPQEPSAPFPYDSKDFTVEDDRVKLSGTITSPKGEGKFPALILVSGSGTHDRDGGMYGHKPFKVLADYLTRRGIVVMRFDDIGIGGSTADINYVETTLTQGENINMLLNRLKLDSTTDLDKIGLLGHSEGSLISLIKASNNSDVKFVVSLGGVGLSGKEMIKQQSIEGLKSLPIEKQQMYSSLFDVMNEEDDDIVRKKMKFIVDNYRGSVPLDGADTVFLSRISDPWFLCVTRLNAADYIRQIKVPVLVLHGEKDKQVIADENVAVFRKELPNNPKTFIKIYPELNHLFQTARTGSGLEYRQIPETFNEEVMDDIAKWIEKL